MRIGTAHQMKRVERFLVHSLAVKLEDINDKSWYSATDERIDLLDQQNSKFSVLK